MPARPLTRALGLAALAFGLYGLVSPRSLARLVGSDSAELGRELGVRDLGNALVFASGANRAALAQRMLFDVSDAVQFGRRRRRVAVAALSAAIVGAVALAREA
jgi:NADH/NAD ratio-sensing transcriptional regulator Rex